MKICLVTGGSRGIGAATVTRFAEEGYTVIANYNKSVQQAQALQSQLNKRGCDVHLYQADVSSVEQISQMFLWVERYFKKLNVLVNNAGVACDKQLQDVSEEDWDRLFATNAKSAFFCCKGALPLLSKQGGAIVNVSSIWGVEGASCESVYSMTKHALVGLTRSLAEELAPSGIRVNCVCPPIVSTEMCSHLSEQDKLDFCKKHSTRIYTPAQVAEDIFTLATGVDSGKILVEN